MPKEKEAYRDNLERIIFAFPGKEVLTVKDVALWMKKDPRTVKKQFPFKEYGISIATLARALS